MKRTMNTREIKNIPKTIPLIAVTDFTFSHSPNISGCAVQPVGFRTGPQCAPEGAGLMDPVYNETDKMIIAEHQIHK